MPIMINCPYCEKAYRLRDELAGKRVTCANPTCRKIFVVTAQPVPVATEKASSAPDAEAVAAAAFSETAPAPKPPPSLPDADAIAAAALAEDHEKQPEDTRVIALTCVICEHKWDVPFAMEGKNVLCPECRHRQKVPAQKVMKAADWRDGGGGPSLARREELEGVQGTVNVRRVGGQALREAGVLDDLIEPRPRWHYVAWVVLPLLVVTGAFYGVRSWRESAQESRQADTMAEAVTKMKAIAEPPYPAQELQLMRAALLIAAGEHTVRQAQSRDDVYAAISLWNTALADLHTAPPTISRDLMIIELAKAWIEAGGTEEQIASGSRIYWQRPAKLPLNEKAFNVPEEIGKIIGSLKSQDRLAPLELRMDALRRISRSLTRHQHPDLIFQMISKVVQDDARSRGELIVENYHGTKNAEEAKAEFEKLKPMLPKGSIPPPAIQALVQALGLPDEGLKLRPDPSAAGSLTDETRETFVLRALLKASEAEALELAKRSGGSPEGRLKALVQVAEWVENPTESVNAAVTLVVTEAAKKDKSYAAIHTSPHMYRLARQLGRSGSLDQLESLLKAVPEAKDDWLRAWLTAFAVRGYLSTRTDSTPVEESLISLPADPKDYRVGHAEARLAIARHNARVATGNPTFAGWHETLQPFGLAGVALGRQDRTQP